VGWGREVEGRRVKKLWLVIIFALASTTALPNVSTGQATDNINLQLLWSFEIGAQEVEISGDGKYICALDVFEGTIYLFTHADNTPIWRYKYNSGWGRLIEMSTDGKVIIYVTEDPSKIYLFSNKENIPLWNYALNTRVTSLSVSPDGLWIVVGTGTPDNQVYLFSKSSNTPLWSYIVENGINTVAISPDGSRIVVGTRGGQIYLFHRASGEVLWKREVNMRVYSSALSQDGSRIVVGGSVLFTDDENNLYEFDKLGSILWSTRIIPSKTLGTPWRYVVSSVAISEDGHYVCALTQEELGYKELYFFQNSSPIPLWVFEPPLSPYSAEISTTPAMEYLVMGAENLYLFSKEENLPLWSQDFHGISDVALSNNGQYMAVGSDRLYLFGPSGESSSNGGFLFIALISFSLVVVLVLKGKVMSK